MLNYNSTFNIEESWHWFSKLCENPRETQQKVLLEILKNANQSQVAKKYDFDKIQSIDDFRNTLPITNWNDYEEASLKMQQNKSNILFNGLAKVFILTSGTAGKPKLIPESELGLTAKSITDKLRQYFTLFKFPDIQKGKILPLVNAITLGKTEAGIPFGTASGITLSNVSKELRHIFSYPLEVLQVENTEALDYLIMRFSLEKDVHFIVGNNIAKMEKLVQIAQKYANIICNDIEKGTISEKFEIEKNLREILLEQITPNPKKAKELKNIFKQKKLFLPKEYWVNISAVCCWLSGSVGMLLESNKYLFSKKTVYLDYGYGATEGKFNIPRVEGKSYGTLTLHSAFYEFKSVNQVENFLLADELQIGEYYHIYITNFSGLYRYNMKDIIKVQSFYEKTPEIVFISKSGDIGDICGEKLAGSTISYAVQIISQKFGLTLKHIEAFGERKNPHYILYLEFIEEKQIDIIDFAKQIDIELQKDLGYKNRRRDNLIMEVEIHFIPSGWLESIYKQKELKGISRTQLKLPVIRDRAMDFHEKR